MKCRRFIEALVLVALAATAARGDDAFKQHYEAGLSRYSSEEYDAAIKEFQAAYAIKAKPRLLFNIGQALRNLGNAREALHYYLLYQALEPAPKPGLKAELDGYIAQMKAIVAQAERAQRAEERDLTPVAAGAALPSTSAMPATTSGAEPALNPYAPPDPRATTTATTAPPSPSLARADTPAPPPSHKRAWIWGVVAGGAAVVIVTGLAVGLTVGQGPSFNGDIRHPMF
jgi:hypothetical protein